MDERSLFIVTVMEISSKIRLLFQKPHFYFSIRVCLNYS